MNIDSISSLLIESLIKQDTVFIHGLGCFKTELQPSVILDNGYTISPPYKKISFSRENKAGATDFTSFYASKQGLSEDEASQIIAEFTNNIYGNLKEESVAEIPCLGKFRAIPDGGIIFIVDRSADLNPEGFGLENVSLRNRTISTAIDLGTVTSEKVENLETENSQTTTQKAEKDSITDAEVHELDETKLNHTQTTKKKKSFGKVLLILFIVALILLLAFLLTARFCPELIDKILYSPEQLEQIKSRGI